MKTIKERANEYVRRNGDTFLSGFENAEREAYIAGAMDEHSISLNRFRNSLRRFHSELDAFLKDIESSIELIDKTLGEEQITEFRNLIEK